MATRDTLERRFWGVVVYNSAELPIGPACKNLFEDLISDGIQRLEAEDLLESQVHLRRAEVNLANFTISVLLEAQQGRSWGPRAIDELSFSSVKERICPLFPFC